jgi:hypothetical protein
VFSDTQRFSFQIQNRKATQQQQAGAEAEPAAASKAEKSILCQKRNNYLLLSAENFMSGAPSSSLLSSQLSEHVDR